MISAIQQVESTRTVQIMRLARNAEKLATLQITESNWADVEDMLDRVTRGLDEVGEALIDFLEN